MEVIQYFRDEVILGEGYPWELMFFHSLKAISSWRQSVEQDTQAFPRPPIWSYNLVCSFFCHGFGGTTFRDWCIGKAPSLFQNKHLPKTWLLAFALVYYSPFNIVYRQISTPRTVFGLLTDTFEAIDSSTTICGSVEKAYDLFPQSPQAPFLLAMLAALGGSIFRYIERRLGRDWQHIEVEWSKPTKTTRVAILYTVAYLQLRRAYGVRNARLAVATFHVAWTLLQHISGDQYDFTEPLFQPLGLSHNK